MLQMVFSPRVKPRFTLRTTLAYRLEGQTPRNVVANIRLSCVLLNRGTGTARNLVVSARGTDLNRAYVWADQDWVRNPAGLAQSHRPLHPGDQIGIFHVDAAAKLPTDH